MKSPYNGQTLPSRGAICQINGPTDGRALIDWEAGTLTLQVMSHTLILLSIIMVVNSGGLELAVILTKRVI